MILPLALGTCNQTSLPANEYKTCKKPCNTNIFPFKQYNKREAYFPLYVILPEIVLTEVKLERIICVMLLKGANSRLLFEYEAFII